jgi:hypothetical protein
MHSTISSTQFIDIQAECVNLDGKKILDIMPIIVLIESSIHF